MQGNLKYTLKNEDSVTKFEGSCVFDKEKNILSYKEQNNTDVLIDLEQLTLTRENEEMLLKLDFNKGESYVQIKNMEGNIPLVVTTNIKELKGNSLFINYSLSLEENFELKIEWLLESE